MLRETSIGFTYRSAELILALYTLIAWLPHLLPFSSLIFSLLIYFLTYLFIFDNRAALFPGQRS